MGLQVIAIPLVYHSLGQHKYELYLLLTAALATIALAQLGAGPGLTQALAKANAERNREHEASLLSAAFRLSAAAAIIGGSAILLVVHLLSPDRLFGPAFVHDRAEVLATINVCVFVLMAQVISGVVDSALAGYQEQVFSNLGSMLANLSSIILLPVVCRGKPDITQVILVLYGVPTLSRVVNLAVLLKRRPHLMRGLNQTNRGDYSVLLHVGVGFWAIAMGGVLEQHSGTFVLAHFSSTQATDFFAVVYRTVTLAGSAVAILTQPLWPALTDAVAHGDIDWIRRSFRRIRRMLTLYSCMVALLLATAGQWVFQRLLHIETERNRTLFVILAVYFIANVWTHLFYIAMMGMHCIWKLACVALAENLFMVLLGILLVPHLGAQGMGLAYLFASILLPVWLLPRMWSSAIGKISSPQLTTAQTAY